MFARDFWRSTRWHTVSSEFHITDGPYVLDVGEDYFRVEWTMSEAASGQIEYGLTSAYGSTTTEEPLSSGLTRHTQLVSGLEPGTTYHFRTKSTSSASVTVYSDDLTAETEGVVVTETAGPRDQPTLPPDYIVIDSSVPSNGTDCSAAMQTFIDTVPNGSTLVLDKTLLAGSQTVYTMTEGPDFKNKVGIRVFGWNAKFDMVGGRDKVNSGIKLTLGSEDIVIEGLEIEGTNHTSDLHRMLMGRAMGVYINGARDVTVKDCTFHHLRGDAVCHIQYVFQSQIDASPDHGGVGINISGKDWRVGGGIVIEYNYFHHLGRQGISNLHGDGIYIRWNIIEDVYLYVIDLEDGQNDKVDPGLMTLNQVYIQHNEIRRWSWNLDFLSTCIVHDLYRGAEIYVDGTCDHFEISDNIFDEGAMGCGSSDSACTIPNTAARACQNTIYLTGLYQPLTVTELVITGNEFSLNANNLNCTIGTKGAVKSDWNGTTLTITGNDFDDMNIGLAGTYTTENISDNGSSSVYRF